MPDVLNKLPSRDRQPGSNCYILLNQPKQELAERITNSLQPKARATKDQDIARRLIIPIDVDPIRAEPGTSATDEEKQAALAVSREVTTYLLETGTATPDCPGLR